MTYRLYTHCGIHRIAYQDRMFLAAPALDDGNGNPPAGWGNPFDDGTLAIAGGSADFVDVKGNRAHFREASGQTVPAPPLCG